MKNKKEKKKMLIIGASAIAAITVSGVTGWMLFKDGNNEIAKFAQSVIAGRNTKDVLAEIEFVPNLSDAYIYSLEDYLRATGFGYGINTSAYGGLLDRMGDKCSEYEFVGDKTPDSYIKVEALYALCNDKNLSDKPEYKRLSDVLYISDDIRFNDMEYHTENIDQYIDLYGSFWVARSEQFERVVSERQYISRQEYCQILGMYPLTAKEPEELNSEEQELIFQVLKNKILNSSSFMSEYEKELERCNESQAKYEAWVEWRTERNEWIHRQLINGNLDKKDIQLGDKWSGYTAFWVDVAQKALGDKLSKEGHSEEAIIELNNLLYAQIYDEYGERRPARDLCNQILEWQEGDNAIHVYTPGEGQVVPGTPGADGGSEGGGGSTGGDGSGEGGSSGGGDSTGGSSGEGEGTGEQEQPDTTPPEVTKIEIMSQDASKVNYVTGDILSIKVTFDNSIYSNKEGTRYPIVRATAPKMKISFGDGQVINPYLQSVDNKEHFLIYQYRITDTDKGELKIDAENTFDGTVKIYDLAGNETALTKGKELSGNKITANVSSENPGGEQGGTTEDPSNPGGNQGGTVTDPDVPGENQGEITDPDIPGGEQGGTTTEPGDNTESPKVQKVAIISPKSGNYAKGQEIKIKVDFNQNIYGTAKKGAINASNAPKLSIKFGENGSNKELTFDSASGKSITYTYIIKDTDEGQILIGTGNNLVGTVYGETGKTAQITKVENIEASVVIKADNQGPKVERIEAISNAGEYKTGSEIEIKVTFNERVYTTNNKIPLVAGTAPNLQISFGSGEIRNPIAKTINNSEFSIIYKYRITDLDRGALKVSGAKAFDGTKSVYDANGNESKLIVGKDLTGNAITANSNLSQITINKEEVKLDLNGTKKDTPVVNVSNNGTATWESSDEGVVTVDRNTGEITATGIGEATVTVKTEDGAKKEVQVTVKDTTNGETRITLNKTNVELDLNRTRTMSLSVTIVPTNLAVTWSSLNDKVARVDNSGNITAVAVGETEIIAKAKDGTTAKCKVKVINTATTNVEPTGIDLNIQNAKVVFGKTETIQLKPQFVPSNSNQNTIVQYESSDETIATVDETGKVTIVGKGTVVITATLPNGEKAYSAFEVEKVETGSGLLNKKIGDINEDGEINLTDLTMLLRHIAANVNKTTAEKHQDWLLDSDKYVLADINGNGVIDVTDTIKLLRHIAANKSDSIKNNHADWTIETNWEN